MSLTPQQYLTVKLVELPITDLEGRVRDELYENVALEEGRDLDSDSELSLSGDADADNADDAGADPNVDTYNADGEVVGVTNYDGDDIPVYTSRGTAPEAEIPIGDTRSFIEELQVQIGEYDVTERERQLIEYLIGSLDGRGFIDRPLTSISDDLAFYQDIEASVDEIEAALHVLQQFEPAGIGARSLQECLLLQIDRQLAQLPCEENLTGTDGYTARLCQQKRMLKLERRAIADHFKLFERNEPARLAEALHADHDTIRSLMDAIAKLNPHPGRSLHEAADDRLQTIVPDFIIDTDHESSISFSLNMGEVPPLRVSAEYLQQLDSYQKADARLTHSQREAYLYTRQKVESAQMFITALQQRQQTLTSTLKAIIACQRDFFLSQDDSLLKPMRLADIQQRTGLHYSTISRVVNSKYALLDGTLYSLKHFFLRTRQNAQGDAVLKTKVYPLLSEIIEHEDKREPLSDERISQLMTERGQAISRRTVAKYRNEMKIPAANLRRRV